MVPNFSLFLPVYSSLFSVMVCRNSNPVEDGDSSESETVNSEKIIVTGSDMHWHVIV